MCGLAGFIDLTGGRPPERLAALAHAMGQALAHRGPDDLGLMIDQAFGVALAHRRLSIIDLSPAGHQPMASASGRYLIVYNGEIYNYAAIRAQLPPPPNGWRGTSDTEVMLAAFEAWGLEALNRLRGMFAIALIDRQDRKLHLIRDRLGVKPLIYGRCDGGLIFGSELTALERVASFSREIDPQALIQYALTSTVPAPFTIYRAARKVSPGEIVSFNLAAPGAPETKTRYWHLHEVIRAGRDDPFTGSADDAIDEAEARLKEAVALRLVADVPVGLFLSGGIDSSAVAALIKASGRDDLMSFTAGFEDPAMDESLHAEKVARHLGTRHMTLPVAQADAIALAPRLGGLWDEPFADSSQIPAYLIAKAAREHVTVALSGDGGDEMFGGYPRYRLGRRLLGITNRLQPLPALAGSLLGHVPERLAAGALAAIRPVLPPNMARKLTPQRLTALGRALDEGPAALYATLTSAWALAEPATEDPTQLPAMAPFIPGLEPVSAMMAADMGGYLPDDILTKSDRAGMAVGLEAREPLLDHEVLAFLARLRPELRHGGGRKALLRHVLARHVPVSLTDRPKAGFSVPLAAWLRGPLRGWAEDLLSAAALKTTGLYAAPPVRAALEAHISGRADRAYEVWNALMLQAWAGARQAAVPEDSLEPAPPHALSPVL